MRKFMGVQDDLAVAAAGAALQQASLAAGVPGERVGLYVAVGHVPFEERDLTPLVEASREGGRFSMARFSTEGLGAVNPLLTFRVLPNMPAFHVSLNFELRGPYFVTYPGPSQFYLALEQACIALEGGTIAAALVGGVAHQRNFLVERHMARLEPPTSPECLGDAAGFLLLETEEAAVARAAPRRARLLDVRLGYTPHDPLREPPLARERFAGTQAELDLGPASLPAALATWSRTGTVEHELDGRDGILARSRWEFA